MSQSKIETIAPINPKGTFATKKKVKLDGSQGDWKPYIPYSLPLLTGDVYRINLDNLTLNDLRLMKDDYQINACLNVITFTIQQVNWRIKASNKEIEDFVEYALRSIWNQLVRATSQSYWAGFSGSVKVFTQDDRSGKIIYKRLRDLSPESVSVIQEEDNTFNGFEQRRSNGQKETIEPFYSFWYPFMMTNGNYYGQKLLKSAYIPWKFSQIIHLYTNRYYERFGEPTGVGRYPVGQEVEDRDGTLRPAGEVMEEILETWRNHTTVTMPSTRDENGNYEWLIDMLETNLYRGVDFESYLNRLDMEKARAIFNPDLLFGSGRVGSYNLGVEQKTTFLVMLNAFLEDLKPYLNEYVIKPLVELNFGTTEGSKPWAEFQYEEFGKLKTDNIVSIVLALIKDGRIKMTADELGRHLGLTIEEVEEVMGEEEKPDNKEDDILEEDKKEDSGPTEVNNNLDREINAIAFRQFGRLKDQINRAFDEDDLEKRQEMLEVLKLGFRGIFTEILENNNFPGDPNVKFSEIESGVKSIINKHLELKSTESTLLNSLSQYFSNLSFYE